jgi:hypothetical protein
MEENEVKQILVDAIRGDPKTWATVLKLDTGAGTYEEVNDIAAFLGDAIAEDLVKQYSEEFLEQCLRAGHDLVSLFAETAQQNLNDAAGIGLKPMKTKPPNARIKTLAEELAAVDPEMLPGEIRNVIPSEMLSMVDKVLRYNMDFQAKAGLHPIIKRTWSGRYPSHDTKHTDWCKDLAGEWAYHSEPKNVYARHKGCRCKVEYYPNKYAKGRITALAKGDIDRDSVLWNTKRETLAERIKKQNKK